MEMTCPDCGMCETHGDNSKDKLDELKCWSGYHRVAGTKAGFPGSCAKNKTNEEGAAEGLSADDSVNYTMDHPIDKEYVYSVYRNGKKEGTYHSVTQANQVLAGLRKTYYTKKLWDKYKITRSPRSKLAGPVGQLPEQGVAEGYQLDEGAVETITALVKKIPGIGKYYQMAQQYKPQLIEILKTSKSGKEVKQKMEQLAAGQSATVAESGMMKQLGGLAVGGGSILSTMWMNAMGMIDGVLANAAAGEVGGAVASGSILGLIPVTLMLFAAMLLFKGSKQSSDEKAQAFQAQRGQQGVAEGEQRVDSIVTDALKIMRGSELSDAVQALKTVLGDREYNSRRGYYNFYVRQILDMYGQQGMAEGWKSALGAAAMAGTMALGAGGANARVMPGDDPAINRLTGKPIATQQATDTAPARTDSTSGFSKEYLQKAANPDRFGRYLISIEKAQELLKNMQEGMAEGALNEKSTSQAQFRTMAAAAHNPEFAKKVGISRDVAKEFHGADRKQDYTDLPKKADEGKSASKEKEADYGDDYQAMVARVKKLAGMGPLKTVYDPARRVYRNVPTAQQPKK
jgi:hypothetical protein